MAARGGVPEGGRGALLGCGVVVVVFSTHHHYFMFLYIPALPPSAHSRDQSTDSGLSVSSLPRASDHMLSSMDHMDTGKGRGDKSRKKSICFFFQL